MFSQHIENFLGSNLNSATLYFALRQINFENYINGTIIKRVQSQNKKLSTEIKQELTRLGAFKPFYSENAEERSIKLTNMLYSDKEKVKNIVLKEVQEYFSINNPDEVNSLLDQIKTYQNNLENLMVEKSSKECDFCIAFAKAKLNRWTKLSLPFEKLCQKHNKEVKTNPNFVRLQKEVKLDLKVISKMLRQDLKDPEIEITKPKKYITCKCSGCNQKTKTEIINDLVERLGEPKNELDNNCLDALAGKVIYFYSEGKDYRSKAISSIIGQVAEITQTTFVEKLELLDQNLLFRYRFSIFGKDICDFQPVESEPITQPQPQSQSDNGGAAAPDPDGENQECSFDIVVYEINNYVGPVNRGRDIINLLKLFAAIDTLAYYFPSLKVFTIPAKQTQQMKEQIINKQKAISGINYKKDNKEFVKELVRRQNKGMINLNLIGCCQMLYYVLFVRNSLQKTFQEPNKNLPYGDHCSTMIDIFIPSLLTVLKKENKLSRGRGKTDTKAWSFLEEIVKNKDFCEKTGIKYSAFEFAEKGVYYHGERRIYFGDLFSFKRFRGQIARVSFKEIVFEEAIPIDGEFLRKDKDDVFYKNLFNLKKIAEEKEKKEDNSGILEKVKDEEGTEWLLYINLIEGEEDAHSKSLREKVNPFSNKKEVDKNISNYCFNLEEKARSKLKECVLRDKDKLMRYKMVIFGGQILIDKELRNLLKEAGFKKF
ncbi:46128_t:CDS:10 [Gigaspora margarita]|uniref:46128_t:CDS:1 n=1 Tax=Gigaspora margarita TaxID=4874 RepID=A0ABN7UUM7_GIGMA|nr:46128_t:CDS:10 [Gigaspora margarita]